MTKQEIRNKNLNGYNYCYSENGIYTFQKRISDYKSKDYGKYSIIRCEEEQLKNGDIENMVKNGITLLDDRIKEYQKKIKNKFDKLNINMVY